MAVHVTWYDEKRTLLYFRFTGNWMWEEFHAANEAGVQMANEADCIVDAVFDFSASHLWPANALSGFRSAVRRSQQMPSEGVTVAFGSRYVASFRRLLTVLVPESTESIFAANDMEEALAIVVREQDKRNKAQT